MSIKLKYNITDRAICISTKHDTLIELKVIERLYFKITYYKATTEILIWGGISKQILFKIW